MKPLLETLKREIGVEQLTPGGLLRGFKAKFQADSLFQNSVYLIATTIVQAAFGFVFWIVAARLYLTEDIGIATALISATQLIIYFSLLGFNSTLIRFLPHTKQRNQMINTSLIVVTLASMFVASLYVLGVHRFAPRLGFLQDNAWYVALFIIFTAIGTMNTLTDSVFIAYRASIYNLIVYTFFSVAKVLSLIVLVGLASYGVFFSYVGAISVAFVMSLFFMWRKFNYAPSLRLDKKILSQVARFSSATYVSAFLGALPTQLFPIMVVNYLGGSQAAYYYIASMVANMLYTIPTATSQSMFAEGSHNENELKQYTISALKVTGLICVPAILVTVLLGQFVLKLFGSSYSEGAYSLLVVFALTTPFISFFYIATTVLKIRHEMRALLGCSLAYAVIAIGASFVTKQYGVVGYGYAFLLAYAVCCVYLGYKLRGGRQHSRPASAPLPTPS